MKIQLKRLNGELIFEHDQEDNTICITFLSALEFRIKDFSGANFRGADFCGANFSGADFRGADFRGADFRDVDFRDVDFCGANFSGVFGIKVSTCSFDSHGEKGRSLTAIIIKRKVFFFCGCFWGSKQELINYINNGDISLRRSRLFALDFVSKAIFFK